MSRVVQISTKITIFARKHGMSDDDLMEHLHNSLCAPYYLNGIIPTVRQLLAKA